MAINNIATSVRNSMCDAFVDAIDGGTSNGVLVIYTSGFGSALVTLPFNDPAFGAASSGTATMGTSPAVSATIGATGTAAVFRVSTTNDGSTPVTTLFEGTVSTSGADINFGSTSFATSDTCTITSLTITMPAS